MATRAASTRRENTKWHYIITGPPATPYHGGQYWGTLVFPTTYPYAPPAIRMHTPSGRFHPSTRLCLSISDFHPKSFNPAWGISTILIGLLSFMTSEEMTTGSIGATEQERKFLARRSLWWNSTGGGSMGPLSSSAAVGGGGKVAGARAGAGGGTTANAGAIKAGDGGARFRSEWPEIDDANHRFFREKRIDLISGNALPESVPTTTTTTATATGGGKNCAPVALRRAPVPNNNNSGATAGGAVENAVVGRGWLARNKIWFGAVLVFGYVLIARIVGDGEGWS
ncbi:MAG: Ubiquitin-conjugating enzyme E2 6 [Peltula sp. TS41687]|nr:MAG: Ubiquitin-conjugating enzyme E2 6 [Peltula sp. TS41687]